MSDPIIEKSKLHETISAAIRDDLPRQVSKELSEYIKRLEDGQEKFEELKLSHKDSIQRIQELTKTLDEKYDEINKLLIVVDSWEVRLKELHERELSCNERETNLAQTLAQMQVESAFRERDNVLTLVGRVFALPQVTVSRQFNHNMNGNHDEATGVSDNNPYPAPQNCLDSKTITEDETTITTEGKEI